MKAATVEAKKLTLGPQNALSQAERYSKGIDQPALAAGEFGVPFLYSTNGEVIWHHDVRHQLNRSRRIEAFHTPDALAERLQRDFQAATERVLALPNVAQRVRPYQREANEAIERALANRKRQTLIAMATGTGKTFTMVNEIHRLMKTGVARRILFLVDRRALAAQAVRALSSFEAEAGLKFDKVYDVFSQRFQREDFGEEEKFDPKVLPSAYLLAPKPGNAFVYVSTIQRMTINLFGREAIWGGGMSVASAGLFSALDARMYSRTCSNDGIGPAEGSNGAGGSGTKFAPLLSTGPVIEVYRVMPLPRHPRMRFHPSGPPGSELWPRNEGRALPDARRIFIEYQLGACLVATKANRILAFLQ
jgi:hypothetical protein